MIFFNSVFVEKSGSRVKHVSFIITYVKLMFSDSKCGSIQQAGGQKISLMGSNRISRLLPLNLDLANLDFRLFFSFMKLLTS